MPRLHRLGLVAFVLGLASVSASPASAYKLIGVQWSTDNPVQYQLHPDGSDDISDGSDLEAVRSAFRSWACVEGSALRFLDSGLDAPDEVELGDGINSVIWDEDGRYMLGPSTLGITAGNQGDPDQIVARDEADIIFNGFQHTWSTSGAGADTDVESVAVHEVGHLLGLDHPCTDVAETDCLGPDQSVMTPALPEGAAIRDPFSDDVDGVIELYAQDEDDPSTCDGPFRQGEPCACNGECVPGLLCTLSEGAETPFCTPNCGSGNASCPAGHTCVLGAPEGGATPGACVAVELGSYPSGAACARDSDCGRARRRRHPRRLCRRRARQLPLGRGLRAR